MILFAAYAAIVWFACYHWRRTWLGFAVYFGALLGLAGLWKLHSTLSQFFGGGWDSTSLALILIAEAFLVAVVGATLVLIPRERREKPCRRCRYELAGLDDPNPTCPECGLAHAYRRPPRRKRRSPAVGSAPAAGLSPDTR